MVVSVLNSLTLVVEVWPLVRGCRIWVAWFAPSPGTQVSTTDSDKTPDQVGSGLLAPQMRRWEVDTYRTKRSGVLQTTGIVTELKDPRPSPYLLVLSSC